MANVRKIGLLLGDEDCWPSSFEALTRRLRAKNIKWRGETYDIVTERVRMHPFSLRAETSYDLVIDRLAWWYFNPREWLKKAAMMDDVYLLNNPFTFQSMEKHTAFCAMMRLGLNIPETWLIPAKKGPEDPYFAKKYKITTTRYNDLFDLPAIADKIGYPLFMKPFDGGGWRGVTRIKNREDLMRDYDSSGQSMMHLQRAVEPYDVFVRSLAIGPQVMVMRYDASKPMHARYVIDHGFLTADQGAEARAINKVINAFFRWEFNSCESILRDGVLHPIDFANACPDIALTSLHFYFPWAIKSLWRWSVFCAVTNRRMRINGDFDNYFAVAAKPGMSYDEKLAEYHKLADKYFSTEEFGNFCAEAIPDVDDAMYDLVTSQEFQHIITNAVIALFPPHEQDKFLAHYRGLMGHWVECQPQSRAADSETKKA